VNYYNIITAIDLKTSDFNQLVLIQSQKLPVLVDFWASWCNPYKALARIFDELENSYQNKIISTKINIEDLDFFKVILIPEKTIESLEYFLKKVLNESGENREVYKNLLFACFLVLEKNPLVPEYRKKLSGVLF
jgi:thioredoxin-like negative regulator of GroEL